MPVQTTSLQLPTHPKGKPPAPSDPGTRRNGFNGKLLERAAVSGPPRAGRFQEGQENFEFALGRIPEGARSVQCAHTADGWRQDAAKEALAHRRMGSALDRLGRFDQAEIEYRTALKLSPNDPKVWNDAGYSYYLQSRFADAERALKTAAHSIPTTQDPDKPRTHTRRLRQDQRSARCVHQGQRPRDRTRPPRLDPGCDGQDDRGAGTLQAGPPIPAPDRTRPGRADRARPRTAHEAQIAAATTPPTATAPALIAQPGTPPVAALRQPPPSGTTLVPRASATSALWPKRKLRCRRHRPRLKLHPSRARHLRSRWTPRSSGPWLRPALRRVPLAMPPLPIPAPMPMPGPVPAFVPPASN